MGLAVLCSGQGGQHPAMFARLKDEPDAAPVLDALSRRCGFDVRQLEDRAGQLDLSDNRLAQLLITGHALAVHATLGETELSACLGYSVGEIAAAACAGGFASEAALSLIEQRAACMDAARAASAVAQSMLACIGVAEARAEAVAEAHGAAIAIVNGPDHVVIGGPVAALDAVEAELAGQGARNLRRLPVQIASHTRWMAAAGAAFAEVLDGAAWRTPRTTLLSGMDGRTIRSKADAVAALSGQIFRKLEFGRSLDLLVEHGTTCALEIGPGRALTRMFEQAHPDVPVRAFEDFRSAAGTAAWAARYAG